MNPQSAWIDLPANLRQLLRCRQIHRRVIADAPDKVYRTGEYPPRSEKLFVMATGRSILELQADDFGHIRDCDSIALNLFVHSTFLPDVYIFEQMPDEQVRRAWLAALPRYNGERPQLALLPSYSLQLIRSDPEMSVMEGAIRAVFGNRFRLVPVFFARHRSTKLFGFSRWLNSCFWKQGLYHLRGSLASAVDFGLKHGFRDIVLCGVDLDDKGYFYGARREKSTPQADPATARVHFTNQSVSGLVPISDWLRYVARRERNVRLWCSSPSSRLSDWMPVYPWPSRRAVTDRGE